MKRGENLLVPEEKIEKTHGRISRELRCVIIKDNEFESERIKKRLNTLYNSRKREKENSEKTKKKIKEKKLPGSTYTLIMMWMKRIKR